MSRREAARAFGIDRPTVDKMVAFSMPPGYRPTKPVRQPKLDPFVEIIDHPLADDANVCKKRRHTSRWIFEWLTDEHRFNIMKDCIFKARQHQHEIFVRLTPPPDHAQVDFGEALGVIGGVRCKIPFFRDGPVTVRWLSRKRHYEGGRKVL